MTSFPPTRRPPFKLVHVRFGMCCGTAQAGPRRCCTPTTRIRSRQARPARGAPRGSPSHSERLTEEQFHRSPIGPECHGSHVSKLVQGRPGSPPAEETNCIRNPPELAASRTKSIAPTTKITQCSDFCRRLLWCQRMLHKSRFATAPNSLKKILRQ